MLINVCSILLLLFDILASSCIPQSKQGLQVQLAALASTYYLLSLNDIQFGILQASSSQGLAGLYDDIIICLEQAYLK